MKTKTINQEVKIDASPHEVYEILMNQEKHSGLIDSDACIDPKVGGRFKIYNGYIEGKNIELVKDKKIVQDWKGDEDCWPENHYSRITILLEEISEGTRLVFTQEEMPEECYDNFYDGWFDNYWKPLQDMFKE
jgi:activator of HSP90 ATPase